MNDVIRQFRDFFVSLKLTVVLLVLGMILVFGATLDQTNLGVWGIQTKWFRSFFVLQEIRGVPVPVFPGGYFIGGLLLLNLLAAHIYRFKFAWKKAGIVLTHVGLIMLLIGELLTGILQDDFSMRLVQGEPKNYSESYRGNELAIIDTTNPDFDDVVVIPEGLLAKGGVVQHPKLPFRVSIKEFHPNSNLRARAPSTAPMGASEPPTPATQGVGLNAVMTPLRLTYKQDERNLPAAYIELLTAEGTLGTWLVTADTRMPEQIVEHNGHTYSVALRFTRNYKPYTLTLQKFSHDVYAGTDIPKNFSSQIRLTTPDGRDDREVLIYMNNPLRYAGLTFYQASFEPGNDKVTVLQVVRNPGWLLPYLACSLIAIGLVAQFCIHLAGFFGKRRRIAAAAAAA